VAHRMSDQLRQAAGDSDYPVDLILPDAVIHSISLVRSGDIRLRPGLLAAVKSAPGSEFDSRFASGIASVITRFEFDAKLHKQEWQAAYKAAVAAAKAAKAADKSRKTREQHSSDDEEDDSEDDEDDSEGEPEGQRPTQARRIILHGPRELGQV
jgi:ribosomal protein L12E/L44/L45/RPP1/RPP2